MSIAETHRRLAAQQAGLVSAVQSEIWHRRYPPSSVMQALHTTCGHPLSAADTRVFTGLAIVLRARGWSFIGECSGPEVLTFSHQASDAGYDYLRRGLEPVTTIVVTLDRTRPTDIIGHCEVEVLLVGDPSGQARLTGLSGLTTHLGVIEAHRPGDPIRVPFPCGRARIAQRVSRAAVAASRR
ncbi:hypothetical protein IU459_37095 [Nocardia amamiensis]|uniref:Uncharacterized protein n=1 Tax=Nocardia amamiensis TaxID=404578 RepID=A0ABS0D4Z6_9NOCA|nr:hypothetical protein [Nocardia amamiensis]MBF6303077.1 hypothetical protein [Nocardia amamiensis]